MNIELVSGSYSVCRLLPNAGLPQWIDMKKFYSITRTTEELSIVCETSCVPSEIQAEHGWSMIKIVGPISFATTGVLASLTQPLADAKISIFALSTYDTDYLMVRTHALSESLEILQDKGFKIKTPLP